LKHLLKILLSILLPLSLPARGQDRVSDLQAEVAFFSDSLCAGRGVGTPGIQLATTYLLRQFRSAGLRTGVQSFPAGERIGHNVVAVTPGWFRRYIVVGAYYDGLGTIDGRMYPGADSNASGVAALLDLARSLPALCRGEVGLVFVAFDGHNADLSGSRVFLERYRDLYPPSMMVCLDILGSSLAPVVKERPDYLIALGGSPYRQGLETANREPRLDLSFDYYGSSSFTEIFYRRVGDQRWFLEAGLPAVMFTSGITMHTNKVTDPPSPLDYPLLSRRIDLIAAWLRSLL